MAWLQKLPRRMHGLAGTLPHLPLLTGGAGEGDDVKLSENLSTLLPYVHYDELACLHACMNRNENDSLRAGFIHRLLTPVPMPVLAEEAGEAGCKRASL